MTVVSDQPEVAPGEQRRQFLIAGMRPGTTVLDVGCGDGAMIAALIHRGCSASGVEIDPAAVRACRDRGLSVVEGVAERLPIDDASVDGIICSLVLPYTDERRAVAEWMRVLKPGGVVHATYHGVGYGWNYLLRGPGLGRRAYGSRMLFNTTFYAMTGRRLPGFLGDTLCQTSRRMKSHYRRAGLRLDREEPMGRVLGAPQFLCHRILKDEAPTTA